MQVSDIIKCLGFWILLIVLANSGCVTSESDDGAKLSSVRLALSEALTQSDIELVRMTVTGDDMDTIVQELTKNDFQTGGVIEFEIDVPAGQYRTFSAAAFMLDDQDEYYVAYEGEQVVHLEEGEDKEIDLTLYGRGYLFGHVYFLEQQAKEDPWRPGDPLADSQGEIYIEGSEQVFSEFAIDENGYFEIELETRSDNYEIRIETTVEKPYSYETYATVGLHQGGDRVEIDLYLIPSDDETQPWITAVLPNEGASGETFEVFGRGFWPDQLYRPIFANFSFNTAIVDAEYFLEQGDDRYLTVEIPVDISTGDAEFYIAWLDDTKSNYVPFVILP